MLGRDLWSRAWGRPLRFCTVGANRPSSARVAVPVPVCQISDARGDDRPGQVDAACPRGRPVGQRRVAARPAEAKCGDRSVGDGESTCKRDAAKPLR